MRYTLSLLIIVLLASLLWWKWPHIRAAIAKSPKTDYSSSIRTDQTGSTQTGQAQYAKAYFAAGCFWCAESSFEHYRGVVDAVSGYAGGKEVDPTYEQVGSQETSHRESVEVIYDPSLIDYADLVEIFWRTADPTDSGGQYVDRGPQYTSAIWYQTPEEKVIAESSKSVLEASGRFGSGKLVTPVLPYTTFYPAEDYHQNYYKVNPLHYQAYTSGSGRKEYQMKVWGADYKYITKHEKMQTASGYTLPTKAELKAKLTPLQYSVTQESDTETPFKNPYWDNKKDGIYVDLVSGVPLYSSRDKYESGTGWPSFTRTIDQKNVALHEDNTFFSTRTEVRGALSDSHLGHVFDDGPVDRGGKRYCMNSAAMRFVPLEDMVREGYGEWVKEVK